MSDPFQERRERFEAYCQRLNEGVHHDAHAGVNYTCPCCGYPTLSERGGYEICPLCFWEDDGQDDPRADEIWGGPNHSYSLTAARENFKRYWIMYSPDNDTRVGGRDSETEIQAKKDACAAFDQMMSADDHINEALTQNVEKCYAILNAETKRKINEYEASCKKNKG